MARRSIPVVLVATLFAVFAGAATADEGTVVPLTGENLAATELGGEGSSTVTGTCNLLGPSTFTFTVTGAATGPYPGTFTESGTITVDNATATTTAFDATFTIISVAGTVTGTKTLSGTAPAPLGLCGSAVSPIAGADAVHTEGTVSYTASITSPTGSGADSGESFVNIQDLQFRGLPLLNGFAFLETFTSTSTVACDDENTNNQGNENCDDQGEQSP